MKTKTEFKNWWCRPFNKFLPVRAVVLLLGLAAANSKAQSSDSGWGSLGSGMNEGVYALAVSGTNLYAGGLFTRAGGTTVNYIAKWDGSTWSALGSGMNGSVYALTVSGTNLYAGGYFTTAGGVSANRIAKWNGSVWSALGSGMIGSVCALAMSGTNLYAGGQFTAAGGATVNYIAKWDGNAWSSLGSGLANQLLTANALAVAGTNLYVGGNFNSAGGVAANDIAKWDGTSWSALGNGIGYWVDGTEYVTALAVDGTNLYAAGTFSRAGGFAAKNIVRWNGSTWSALGSGTDGSVRALAADGARCLFVGGNFTNAGGVSANCIAKWDSSTWSALGSGTDGSVRALAADGAGHLFVGGNFTNAFGVAANYIAEINPSFPAISVPPQSQTAAVGRKIEFNVVVTGDAPLAFQWFFNGTNPISWGTNSSLVLTNIQIFQSGAYTVVVTNWLGAATSSPAMLDVVEAGVVTEPTDRDLRAVMAEGGRVVFSCDGTITLAGRIVVGTDTVLDGSGHQISISGGNSVQVFYVNTNATLTLLNLTVANGRGTDGGGIYIAGGTVNATNCTFVDNLACGTNGADGSYPGQMGGEGRGGAIYNLGAVNVYRCNFVQNSATGGVGGEGMLGEGSMGGEPGGAGGLASAGAIYNSGFADVGECLFAWNSAMGGVGGRGGTGGWYGGDGGWGGYGGSSLGSAIFNEGLAILVNSTFALNYVHGGMGGEGGYPGPRNPYQTEDPTYGPDGAGGIGFGVIFSTNGILNITNCTLANNSSTAGSGTPGSNSDAGVGGLDTIGAVLINTLLSGNSPSNCAGVFFDAGHNLSSDNSCAFTGASSRNNVDPMLGPLADNGGPTLTMALLSGSPAIDAGDDATAPPTDQRGFPRPVGPATDIGAYELCYIPVLKIGSPQTGTISVLVYGLPGQSCRLLASDTFANWLPIATNQISPNGTTWFQDNSTITQACRFYRVVTP